MNGQNAEQLNMQYDIMIANELLKVKILRFENDYLIKKGIVCPDTKTIMSMRRAVSAKLKKDIHNITIKHDKLINSLF